MRDAGKDGRERTSELLVGEDFEDGRLASGNLVAEGLEVRLELDLVALETLQFVLQLDEGILWS